MNVEAFTYWLTGEYSDSYIAHMNSLTFINSNGKVHDLQGPVGELFKSNLNYKFKKPENVTLTGSPVDNRVVIC